ncbi:putative tRNA sulfurtransferase [bacterium HR29]|jgi:thiamine biosynthesis protein ThiI|nr:putative tRNA sulfurtransferase [bacterium HR29]
MADFAVEAQTSDELPARALEPGLEWRVIVRFSEIALKGRNKEWFMRVLRDNTERALTGLPVSKVTIRPNRCFVHLEDVRAWPEVRKRLRWVFGISNFSLAVRTKPDIDALAEAFDVLVREPPTSFCVRAQRGEKSFPLTTPEIERAVGAAILRRHPMTVDLRHPELTFGVEIQREGAFAFVTHEEGPGGLPVGTSGRVAVLLSGGIDSPVAAYRLMQRGCRIVFVHFTSFPFTDPSSWEKCRELVKLLTRHQFESRLYACQFGYVQQRIVVSVPAELRIIAYRRMMLRIAEAVAHRERCEALGTGESLGQVGSQTLTNMATIDRATELLVLRPLVAWGKSEITAEAQRIGTYEISIEPDMDCCQFLVPPRVATHATAEEMEAVERELDIQGLVDLALSHTEVEEFRWPESTPSRS